MPVEFLIFLFKVNTTDTVRQNVNQKVYRKRNVYKHETVEIKNKMREVIKNLQVFV